MFEREQVFGTSNFSNRVRYHNLTNPMHLPVTFLNATFCCGNMLQGLTTILHLQSNAMVVHVR